MRFDIITIFPDIFDSYFNESIIKRAKAAKKIEIITHDLRKWTDDRHRTVDDKPYGGGPGMILKATPIISALAEIKEAFPVPENQRKTILFSASGKQWNQKRSKEYSGLKHIIMVCGRYEGVDARVKKVADEEISIGKYILTGGELPAMVLVDTIARMIPGVLGNADSIEDESFSEPGIKAEYPQYTRPEKLAINGRNHNAPKVLLQGNHFEIRQWREKKKKKKVKKTIKKGLWRSIRLF